MIRRFVESIDYDRPVYTMPPLGFRKTNTGGVWRLVLFLRVSPCLEGQLCIVYPTPPLKSYAGHVVIPAQPANY